MYKSIHVQKDLRANHGLDVSPPPDGTGISFAHLGGYIIMDVKWQSPEVLGNERR